MSVKWSSREGQLQVGDVRGAESLNRGDPGLVAVADEEGDASRALHPPAEELMVPVHALYLVDDVVVPPV
eukprot:12519480-Heterocapsa_arctica.AAC.1